MADEKRKVSLLITAKDLASSVIRGTSTIIQGIAAKIGGAFALVGKATVGLNAGLELAKKILGAVSAAYAATVAKALELRGANDPARRDLEALGKAAADLQVSIGNALIPVIQTLAQSLTPVIKSMTAWVNANRDAIATNVVTWAVNLGRTLVSGVATGALLAARAWYGFGFAVDAVQAAAQTFFAAWAEGNAELLGWMAQLADFAGQQGLAGRLRGLSNGVAEWGAAGRAAAAANVASMEATGLELMAIERGINKVVDVANTGLGGAAVAAVKNLGNAVVLTSKQIGTLKGDADGAYQAWLALQQATARANIGEGARQLGVELRTAGTEFERLAKNAELQDQVNQGLDEMRQKYGALADAAFKFSDEGMGPSLTRAAELLETFEAVFDRIREFGDAAFAGLSSSLSTFLKSTITGTQEVGDAFETFIAGVGDAILTALIDKLIVSGVLGLFETLFGGFLGNIASAVGDLLGIQGGGIVGPARMATGGVVRMADGGSMVRGSGYSDSVRALVSPGELVTPYRDVQRNVAAGRAPGDSGLPRRGERSAGPITVVVQSFVPPSSSELDRQVQRGLAPSLRSAARSGRLRLA